MSVGPLASGSVTLDANGAGIVTVGPQVYGYVWNVTRLVTSCSAAVTLIVYRQIITPSAQMDSTIRGNATSETDFTLNAGEQLIAAYSGGTPGLVATFNIQGEQVPV